MNASQINSLATRLAAAAAAYHNGQTLLMTDDEFDAGVDALRTAVPNHPFLAQVGAPIAAGDEVALPIPLPSLNKIKPADGSLETWVSRYPALAYHASVKLDGCSALWLPTSKKLYTRGDGMCGRDISAFVPYMKGLIVPPKDKTAAALSFCGEVGKQLAVRGELIMRTDSTAIPAGKLARNIVAGALNRKDVDPALFSEIRFVAYELVQPSTMIPLESFALLSALGFETARHLMIPPAEMTPTALSATFSNLEAASPYQLDGIVIAPNNNRPAAWAPEVRKGVAVNPADRVAWKTRLTATTAMTTVRGVDWNVSAGGVIIPRVLFDPVQLAGATISAATGLHGRWIFDNAVGPGAAIEIRRAGDVIPQIIAVHTPAPAGAAMPPAGTWIWDGSADTAVHIRPAAGSAEGECAVLTRALSELGAENVGPGIVAKLYAAGFRTVGQIFAATAADFASRVEGFKAASAQRTYEGLRAGAAAGRWAELHRMVASGAFGRGVGHSKLQSLLAEEPDVSRWSTAMKCPAGLSTTTLSAIVAAIPTYLAWRSTNPLPAAPAAPVAATQQPPPKKAVATGLTMTVVLTGFRDKALETALQAAGHTIADTVSKKVTHVVHPDGPTPTSAKITKAQDLGIPTMTVSALRALLA